MNVEALVLAAGNGARLLGVVPEPKPLVPVAGLPLLDHVVGALALAGVERVHVVTGHRHEALVAHRFAIRPPGGVDFVHNPSHEGPNGLSLLAARERFSAPFLLLMADHLFAPATLARLIASPCAPEGGLLVVDRDLERVFDLQDATRVRTRGDRVVAIGKGLVPFDAVDTGMFLLSLAVFDAMRQSLAHGDGSLSGGIRELAGRGVMWALEVGGADWIDVDTPGALAQAERLVRAGVVGCPHPVAGR